MKRNKCGKGCVVHVFDKKDSSDENHVNHVAALQREGKLVRGRVSGLLVEADGQSEEGE